MLLRGVITKYRLVRFYIACRFYCSNSNLNEIRPFALKPNFKNYLPGIFVLMSGIRRRRLLKLAIDPFEFRSLKVRQPSLESILILHVYCLKHSFAFLRDGSGNTNEKFIEFVVVKSQSRF